VPEITSAEFLRKFKRPRSDCWLLVEKKLVKYLKILITSSIIRGSIPINLAKKTIKTKLEYTILSLNLIEGVLFS